MEQDRAIAKRLEKVRVTPSPEGNQHEQRMKLMSDEVAVTPRRVKHVGIFSFLLGFLSLRNLPDDSNRKKNSEYSRKKRKRKISNR